LEGHVKVKENVRSLLAQASEELKPTPRWSISTTE
jgi:hypothetical protein